MSEIICFRCQKTLTGHDVGQKVFRTEECPHCQAPIRCCQMCKHYSPKDYNECHEPVAERILEKEKSNFCEFYVLAGDINKGPSKSSLVDSANSLFKK